MRPVPTGASGGAAPMAEAAHQTARLVFLTRASNGTAEIYRRSGLIISREQGLRYVAGFAVPVLMSCHQRWDTCGAVAVAALVGL